MKEEHTRESNEEKVATKGKNVNNARNGRLKFENVHK